MTADRLESLVDDLRAFVEERDWSQFHDPKNLTMALVSEAGELAAELRWVAGPDADRFVREGDGSGRVRAEIGDVAICLLLLCDRAGIDLVQAAQDKLARNRLKYPADASRGRADPATGPAGAS